MQMIFAKQINSFRTCNEPELLNTDLFVENRIFVLPFLEQANREFRVLLHSQIKILNPNNI